MIIGLIFDSWTISPPLNRLIINQNNVEAPRNYFQVVFLASNPIKFQADHLDSQT